MMKRRATRPSDLATKRVLAPDGSTITMKVVQAESPTFGDDFLAAFRANVRRIRADDRKRGLDTTDAQEA